MSGYKTEGDQGLCLLPDAAGIFEVSLCLDPFRPEVTAGALIFFDFGCIVFIEKKIV